MLVCLLLHISASANKRKFEVFHILKNTYFKLLRTQKSHEDPKRTELFKRTFFLFNSL